MSYTRQSDEIALNSPSCSTCAMSRPLHRLGIAPELITHLHCCTTHASSPPGTLPVVWANMTKLTDLLLANNRLNGTIPWNTAAFFPTAPRLIDITNNRLTGQIPVNFASVAEVLLGFNLLTGTIGPSWDDATATTRLLLPGNNITGTMPVLTSALGLTELDLTMNQMTGALQALPAGVVRLGLRGNSFSGPLPATVRGASYTKGGAESIGGMWLLHWMLRASSRDDACFIWCCSFCSCLGPEFSCMLIRHTGPFARVQWSSLSQLQSLQLNGNGLTGTLPTTWGQWGNLTEFVLEGCMGMTSEYYSHKQAGWGLRRAKILQPTE